MTSILITILSLLKYIKNNDKMVFTSSSTGAFAGSACALGMGAKISSSSTGAVVAGAGTGARGGGLDLAGVGSEKRLKEIYFNCIDKERKCLALLNNRK